MDLNKIIQNPLFLTTFAPYTGDPAADRRKPHLGSQPAGRTSVRTNRCLRTSLLCVDDDSGRRRKHLLLRLYLYGLLK